MSCAGLGVEVVGGLAAFLGLIAERTLSRSLFATDNVYFAVGHLRPLIGLDEIAGEFVDFFLSNLNAERHFF